MGSQNGFHTHSHVCLVDYPPNPNLHGPHPPTQNKKKGGRTYFWLVDHPNPDLRIDPRVFFIKTVSEARQREAHCQKPGAEDLREGRRSGSRWPGFRRKRMAPSREFYEHHKNSMSTVLFKRLAYTLGRLRRGIRAARIRGWLREPSRQDCSFAE